MRPVVYIESSVISYRVARTSRDIVVAGHQAVTGDWWERVLPKFEAVISAAVMDEISAGDPAEAAKRMEAVRGMEVLAANEGVIELAAECARGISLPATAKADVLHLALATWYEVDYLVTWNCRYIANEAVRRMVTRVNNGRGFETPTICTPEELLELNR